MTLPEEIEPAAWLTAVRLHAETCRSKVLVPVAEARAGRTVRENGDLVSRISLSELATASRATRDQVRTANGALAQVGLTVELTAPTGKAPAAVALRIPLDLATQVSLVNRKAKTPAFTSEIVLTEKQQRVVSGIVDFVTRRPKITGPTRILRVHGYAGTGKTTVIAAALRALEAAGKTSAVVAPTGKAAHVLRQKGLPATTAHSVLYQPRGESEDGSPEFSVNLDAPVTTVDVVVIDECSMISEQMAEHFAYNARAVVAVGDPMQLPPVNSDTAPWAVRGDCDYELTEVLRTDAREVLDLAHRLRSDTWDRATVNAHPTRARGPVNPHDYDAIIVHKNADRWRLIEQMRGGPLPPAAGDEIMSLTNDNKARVINGQSFKVLAQVGTATVPERLFHTKAGPRVREAYTYYILDVEGDGKARRLYAHALGFSGREHEKLVASMKPRRHNKRPVLPATFGRVLTAHKAQGSEWDRVLVVVDLDDLERVTGTSKAAQWLYTAVTRARHQVAIADLSQISGLG